MSTPHGPIAGSIVVTAHDQAALRQAVSAATLSRRLLLTGAIVLPVVLIASVFAVAGGDPLALLMLGVVGVLCVLFLVLVVAARVVSARSVVRAYPIGAAAGISVDDDGIGFSGPASSALMRWPAIAGFTRVGGALRLSGIGRAPALFLPGRLLDDADVEAVAARIAAGSAS
ncbi:MAG: hypothetical protein J7484_09330 [Microbacterium sp.]|nr:hypothetical protein [Microbacterium sp.]